MSGPYDHDDPFKMFELPRRRSPGPPDPRTTPRDFGARMRAGLPAEPTGPPELPPPEVRAEMRARAARMTPRPGPPASPPSRERAAAGEQRGAPGPEVHRFRACTGIPADIPVVMKGRPGLILEPFDGHLGFGYYKESDEEENFINFHPIIATREGVLEWRQGQASLAMEIKDENGKDARESIEHEWQPRPFPYSPPSKKPSSPPPDLIDPRWIQCWEDTKTIDLKDLPEWRKTDLLETRLQQLYSYIYHVKGPRADQYKKEVKKMAEECGGGMHQFHDQKWFEERRGMLGREEYSGPVSCKNAAQESKK